MSRVGQLHRRRMQVQMAQRMIRSMSASQFCLKLNHESVLLGEPPTWVPMEGQPDVASHGSGVFVTKKEVLAVKGKWIELLKWKMGQAREEAKQDDLDATRRQQAADLNAKESAAVAEIRRSKGYGDGIKVGA